VAAAINQAWQKSGNDGVKISADDLASVWLRDGGVCQYCGIEVDLMHVSFDHEIPLRRGGYNGVGNLKTACITCQRSKYTKSTAEYAEWQALWRYCRTCRNGFKPRWADYMRGFGFYCSRKCSGSAASHG
jgi:hypothetical protein